MVLHLLEHKKLYLQFYLQYKYNIFYLFTKFIFVFHKILKFSHKNYTMHIKNYFYFLLWIATLRSQRHSKEKHEVFLQKAKIRVIINPHGCLADNSSHSDNFSFRVD